jgi:hypothetical protein
MTEIFWNNIGVGFVFLSGGLGLGAAFAGIGLMIKLSES